MVQNLDPDLPAAFVANTTEGPIEITGHSWENSTTLALTSDFISDPGTVNSIDYTQPVDPTEQLVTLAGYTYPTFNAV